jgi:sodium transport system ATP-binding protein
MIETQNLRKSFGKTPAVEQLGFAAPDGAITTLLGGNGSGKTTTLRMICGLIRPDAGTARVDGLNIATQRRAALARCGVLHDELGLYPRLTPREHLAFSAELYGLKGRARDAALERAIDLLEIGGFADRPTKGFSHGQRIKVALARALVHAPRNVILDEPTRGLDVFALRMLRRVLQQLRAGGACVLMSSHALAEITELSDNVVVVDGGCVRAVGSPAELMAKTGTADLESAFVALLDGGQGKGGKTRAAA